MPRHRRRARTRPRHPTRQRRVPRFAAGRSADAVDWVGGIGTQDPDDGHLTIDVIMGLHHDQARALYRAYEAISWLKEAGIVNLAGSKTHAIAMPVDEATGDAVDARLNDWRLHGAEASHRKVGAIALGVERRTEVPQLPARFTTGAITTRNGRLLMTLKPDTFGVLQKDWTVIGRIDGGEPLFDASQLEDEPQFVSGIGCAQHTENAPAIFLVLALGRTTAEAITRGDAVFQSANLQLIPGTNLAVGRVTPIDGRWLREIFEQNLETLEGADRRAVEVALGLKDDLIADDEWRDIDAKTRERMLRDDPAQLAMDSHGRPQLWEPGSTVNPNWAD